MSRTQILCDVVVDEVEGFYAAMQIVKRLKRNQLKSDEAL